MNAAGYPAAGAPVQGGGVGYHACPGQPAAQATVQFGNVNVMVDPPTPTRDYVVWSLCCFIYGNPLCLGLAALVHSFKARDRKMVGDVEGARHYANTARCLNIISTTLVSVIALIVLISVSVTAARFSRILQSSYGGGYGGGYGRGYSG